MNESSLCVIIPAFNEEGTIGEVVEEIPRSIKGFGRVLVVVVDDGSTDETSSKAKTAGADLVYRFKRNRGLAQAFNKGIEAALRQGAHVVVTIDADKQYDPKEIPKVVEPILSDEADVVLTDRGVWALSHMPLRKKAGNTLATWVLRIASGHPVRDGQSGFRAFSREAAKHIHIHSNYTYVAESIIQLSNKGMKIRQIPCSFHERKGNSKLIKNIFFYAYRAGLTIVRTYLQYKALKTFVFLGVGIMSVGSLLGFRFIYFYLQGSGAGHIQSLILAAIMLLLGFQVVILGLISDLIKVNRSLIEEISYKLRD